MRVATTYFLEAQKSKRWDIANYLEFESTYSPRYSKRNTSLCLPELRGSHGAKNPLQSQSNLIAVLQQWCNTETICWTLPSPQGLQAAPMKHSAASAFYSPLKCPATGTGEPKSYVSGSPCSRSSELEHHGVSGGSSWRTVKAAPGQRSGAARGGQSCSKTR